MEQRQYTIYIYYSIIASSGPQSRCRQCPRVFTPLSNKITYLHILANSILYIFEVYNFSCKICIADKACVDQDKVSTSRQRDTSSLSKLENAIHDLWKNLDRKYLKTLIDSIPKRLKEVISGKGKATSYQVIEYLTYLFTNCDIYGMTPQVLRNGIQFILI